MKAIGKTMTGCIVLAGIACLGFFVATWCSGDMVDREFSWLIGRGGVVSCCQVSCEKKDWFKAYVLTDTLLRTIHGDDYLGHGYLGWRRFTGEFGPGAGLRVDGRSHTVFVNEKQGSDESDFVKMFLDVDTKELVLAYGRTYGR